MPSLPNFSTWESWRQSRNKLFILGFILWDSSMACRKIPSKTRFFWSLTMDLWGENGLCASLTKHLKIRGDHWSSGNQPHGTGESAVFLEDVPIESSISFGAAPEGVTLKRHKVGATLRPGNFLGLAMKNHHTSHSHSSTCRSFRLDVDPWIFQTFALLISLRNCTTGE